MRTFDPLRTHHLFLTIHTLYLLMAYSQSLRKPSLLSLTLTLLLVVTPHPANSYDLKTVRRTQAAEQLLPHASAKAFMHHEMRDAPPAGPTLDVSNYGDQGEDGGDISPSLSKPTPTTTSRSAKTPATTAPAFSCNYYGPESDGFRPEGWCVCLGSITLPLTSAPATAPQSASCDYKALPSSTPSVTKAIPPPKTSDCEIYQQVAVNRDNDASVPGCIPTGRPQTNVTLSRIPVHVGNMSGDGMIDSIRKALKPHCPDPIGPDAYCDTKDAPVDGVEYLEKDGQVLEKATVTFNIADSIYSTEEQINSMIYAAATGFNGSASGKNCEVMQYDTCQGGESEPSSPNDVSSPGPNCFEKITMCNASNAVNVEVFEGGHVVARLWVEAKFHIDGWNIFDCELIVGVVGVLLDGAAVYAPEIAADAWTVLGDIQATCDQLAAESGG